MSKPLQVKHLHTDVLIIGGGTAGCYAALTISRNSGLNILVAEKANIKRSGPHLLRLRFISRKMLTIQPTFILSE